MFMLNELLIKDLSEKVEINTSDIQSIKDAEVYSINEVKTNKVWKDGKSIYRKVFSVNITNNNSDTKIPNSIINQLHEVIDIYGTLKNSFSNRFPITYTSPNTQLLDAIGCYYNNNDGITIRIGSSSLGSVSYALVIIEYTKTTD